MTQYRERKLLLELVHQKPGLQVPELFDALEMSEIDARNEINVLEHSNARLRAQTASLRASNEELEAYAHTIAHDLKTPLAIMIASCDAIKYVTDLTPQELEEFTQQIRSTAYEMNTNIDNLLLLAEVRQVDAPAEPIDMASIVATARKRLSRMIREYQGRITFPKTWPAAVGYAPWIEEVWANYISNALKYGGPSPEVKLGATNQPDGMVRFWIRDNGPGLTSEAQARLFSSFTQVGNIHKAGHGLGLSIVRRIVEKQGGQVGVESEYGKGSLFFFTLPACQEISEVMPEGDDTVFQQDARLVAQSV